MYLTGGVHPLAALIAAVIVSAMLYIMHQNQQKREKTMIYWIEESQSKLIWQDEFDRQGGRAPTMEWITEYCLTKPGAVKDYPFGPEPLVIKVGGKMFALLSGQAISLKCDPVVAENLREKNEAITPGYHMNKKHWNSIRVDGSLSADEIRSMIDHSYELVFKGLPKSVREKVGVTVS